MKIFGFEFGKQKANSAVEDVSQELARVLSVDDLAPMSYAGQTSNDPWQNSIYDGGKYAGGFGPTQLFQLDYWTLRARSSQLFTENLYARGLIRRLITNEINTGLTPDAAPEEGIIGVEEDSLNGWTDNVEDRFAVWSKGPKVCDWKKQSTFGAIQRAARAEALISGDVLVVLRQSQQTKLPMVQLISGAHVRTPIIQGAKLQRGHTVQHGVEKDRRGRVVAYWIVQDSKSEHKSRIDHSNIAGDFFGPTETKRLPAFGEKSGRRIAWLVYGTDKRLDDVRGQPLLSLVLQSLKEVDRYRDSVQRKAVLNSVLAMFIKKTEDKPGTLPLPNGAVRRGSATVEDADGKTRQFNTTSHIPGLVLDELQTGEEPVGFHNQGTDEKFGTFEEAIIQAVAWANEIPPEILRLAFSNNYSASQAAINEFKIYLNKVWSDWGETFCTPIYIEWLLSETLLQKISAPGLLQAWRDPAQYDIFGAWTMVVWYGSIKPSTDTVKQAKGSKLMLEMGLTTHAREARNNTGTKFRKNVQQLKRENKLLAEATRPLLELQAEFGTDQTGAAIAALDDATESLLSVIEDGVANGS